MSVLNSVNGSGFLQTSQTSSVRRRRGYAAICKARYALFAQRAGSDRRLLDCEALEPRQMMTGTWTTLTNAVPASDGAQNAVLLSDGTVMVHGGKDSTSAAWYKLTPNNGNYSTGTWTTLASSPVARLFDATNVLPNGKVMVLGGEYASTGNFSNTGEIYDPVANSWSVMAPFPQTSYGDDPTETLPNGNILAGYVSGPQTYIYNPTTNAWSSGPTKLLNDQSDEEGWVKLPDDSILCYNVFASVGSGTSSAQRYYPSTNTWVATGNLPAQLSSATVGYELGPGLLLPDGRVFFGGGTNATAYYTPSTNTWTAGPSFPSNYCMADAPGAVLPNGDLLLTVSPKGGLKGGSYNFPGPSYVYELNPVTNVYTSVTPSLTGFSTASNSFIYTDLDLPTGQVLMFNESGKVAIYTPSGSANPAWAPTISNITNNAGTNTFTLTGYQLNGISEGAAYGDDNEMASNYPIVQLTDQNGNITYARTFNWTLNGVASANSSVSFTEPAIGNYLVSVIANGIASPTVLDLQCSAANGESFSVQPYSANTAYAAVDLGINGALSSKFLVSSFSSLIMTGDAANNTLVIDDNLGGIATIINGGNGNNDMVVENNGTGNVTEYGGSGTDYYDFTPYSENLSNIANSTYVQGGTGNEQARLYDNNYSSGTTYTVNTAGATRPGMSSISYLQSLNGISLTTGSVSDTVNVANTSAGTPVSLDSGGGVDAVNIGNAGSVQGIAAPVSVNNTSALSAVTINDSADGVARSSVLISANGAAGSISSLAPAPIYWATTGISGVAVNFGTAAATVSVTGTNAGIPLSLNSGVGSDTVNIGNAGSVQTIAAPVIFNNAASSSALTIDDSADSVARPNAVISTVGTIDTLSGLAPAPISWVATGSNRVRVAVNTGSAAATVSVTGAVAGSPITLNSAGGADAVNIGSAGSVQAIAASVTINNAGNYSTITIDDSADSVARSNIAINANGTTGSLSGLAPVPIYWSTAAVNGITIDGGTGGNSFFITSAGIPYLATINTGTGDDSVQFINAIAGSFSINGQTGANSLVVNDSSSTAGQNWLETSTSLNRSGFSVSYASIAALTLVTGSGSDLVDTESLPPCSLTISNTGGLDAYNESTTSGVLPAVSHPLTFSGGSGGALLTLNDASGTSAINPIITSTTVNVGTGIVYSGITALTFDMPNFSSEADFTSTNSTTAYVINGGNATSLVDIGQGNLGSVVSAPPISKDGISFNAVPKTGSELFLNDSNSSAGVNYDFNAGSIALAGQLTIGYSGVSTILLNAGAGNDTFTLAATIDNSSLYVQTGGGTDTSLVIGTSSQAPAYFDAGGAGTNTVTVGAIGGTLANLNSTVAVNGYAGLADTLVVNDLTDHNFNVSGTSVTELSSAGGVAHEVDYSAVQSLTVNVGAGGTGNLLNVNSTAAGTPVTVNNNSASGVINVNSTAANAPVIISPSAGGDSINVGTAAAGTANAEFIASQQIGALTIGDGGTALLPTGPRILLQADSVAASGSGTLDLTTNDMIVHSQSLSAVSALVADGFNSGGLNWAGHGITSSTAASDSTHLTALGTIVNSYDGVNTIFNAGNLFDGIAPASTDILIKYTYYGDADLTGVVDGSDLTRIDSGYLTGATGWYNGQFNYSGVTDGSDYTLIDNAFNTQGASLAAQIADAAVKPLSSTSAAPLPSFFSQRQVVVQQTWAQPGTQADTIFSTNIDDVKKKSANPELWLL